jgi:SAM-dependent methyltransferase
MQPLINYTGLDIGDYNQEKPILADEYLITCPENFAYEIEKRPSHYDSILSSHNIEHCLDRKRTLIAMMRALRPGGRLYIAFPSSRSIDFPRRQGTLNYYDDSTHIDVPPDFDEYLALLSAEGFSIDYSTKRYRPIIMRILGFINERRSKNSGIVMTGTWEYYGFESIIWARKK